MSEFEGSSVTRRMESDPRFVNIGQKMERFKSKIVESELLDEVCKSVADVVDGKSLRKIRCLALGSPTESNSALYQLVMIIELSQRLGLSAKSISFYDPVFNSQDRELLETKLGHTVEETFARDSDGTLYFLPHATLDLTETLLVKEEPRFLLGNDMIAHTDGLTRRELHSKFPSLAALVNLLNRKGLRQDSNDDFVKVSKKKRNKKNKLIYQEPEIDYNYSNSYYTNIDVNCIKKSAGDWGNAFTDLCFHHITGKLNEDT